jgi:hypothetical protein
MIYHDRPEGEHTGLAEVVAGSVHSDPRRREVEAMAQSYADVLMERGERKGRQEGLRTGEVRTRQQTLVRQLRLGFGRVPRAVEQAIRATDDVARLDRWLDGVVTAATLDAVGIAPRSGR